MSGRVILRFLSLLSAMVLTTSCAYTMGVAGRSLPGGYKQVAVPMFENKSREVGVEAEFTTAMIRAIERANVASVSSGDHSPVRLEGAITKVNVISNFLGQSGEIKALPDRAVLTTEYRLEVHTELRLVHIADGVVLWKGAFRGEKAYPAPRIGAKVLNSANVLYNQSARRMNIAELAVTMMEEAHDRMTENF